MQVISKHNMRHSSSPVLFIHYGAAHYLRWALKSARCFNPEKRIVILGDEDNIKSAHKTAEHRAFKTLSSATKIKEFHNVFQLIQGEKHRFTKHGGVEKWVKFVFLRWFLIEEFLLRENIDSFWTFDSDTLILENLAHREMRFQSVEATTQCRGQCLNGWIGSRKLVSNYTDYILQIFKDAAYLDGQRERLKTQAGLAFNEMDAFSEFQNRMGIRTQRASEVIDGEAFDDALAFVENYEVADRKILGRTKVKRLWTSPYGGVWARCHGKYVRMLSCNMSWMPDFVWRKVAKYSKQKNGAAYLLENELLDLEEIKLLEPLADLCIRTCKLKLWSVRQGITRNVLYS
jgi:hypothetical protein